MADAITKYFDAWNRHRDEWFAEVFAPGGTYCDPMTGGPIPAAALPGYAARLRSTLPDLRFEIVSMAEGQDGVHAARWRMLGTNTGSFQGLPPTGKSIDVPGADFIRVVDGRITTVDGFFDSGAVPRQLGLTVVVQPTSIGPFTFGTSARVAGKDAVPGAMSVTVIEGKSAEDFARIRELTRETAMSMTQMKGFIGLTTATVGLRGLTVSSWQSPEDVAQLHQGPHTVAMREFWTSVGDGGYTTVWTTPKLNANWRRCDACGKMARHPGAADASCGCGAKLRASVPWG